MYDSTTGDQINGLERTLELPPLLARTQRSSLHVRCECPVCGAHSYARPDQLEDERCGNCLSTGLNPIEEVAPPCSSWGNRRRQHEIRVARAAAAGRAGLV